MDQFVDEFDMSQASAMGLYYPQHSAPPPPQQQHYAQSAYRQNSYGSTTTASTEFNSEWREPRSEWIELVIRQQPKEGLVTPEGKEKTRKPIDPPPIVEMKIAPTLDPHQHFLQSPYFFMTCSLVDVQETPISGAMIGMLTSSLHRLKDISNKDGGFFVFGDLSAKKVGNYKLHFALFDLRGIKDGHNPRAVFLKEIWSDPFRILSAKDFKGMEESTYLSRAFSDQGVRLRLRKEPRAAFNKKRSYDDAVQPANQEYEHDGREEEVAVEENTVKRQRYHENSDPYQYPMYPQHSYSTETYGTSQAYPSSALTAMPSTLASNSLAPSSRTYGSISQASMSAHTLGSSSVATYNGPGWMHNP